MLGDRECALGKFILAMDFAWNCMGVVYAGALYVVSWDDSWNGTKVGPCGIGCNHVRNGHDLDLCGFP